MKALRDVIVSHIETLLIFSERIFEGLAFHSRPSNPFGLLKGFVLLVNNGAAGRPISRTNDPVGLQEVPVSRR